MSSSKATIARNEYLQLVGLITLGKKNAEFDRQIRSAALLLTGEIDREGEPETIGHTTDMIWGDRDVDEGLKLIGITVVD